MSFYTLSYATSSTLIELRITDPKDSAKSQVISNPKYITGLTHEIVADGIANKLTLSLTHFIDPLAVESDYPKDIFGQIASSPSYIMVLLNNGLQNIEVRYGYAQGTESADKSMTSWFKMTITDVGLKYNVGSVTYVITAVSCIVSENLQTYTYNWRLMEETDENSLTVTQYDSTRMKTIIEKAIVASSTSDFPVKGLNCKVTYSGPIPILPAKIFTDSSNSTLMQTNTDNMNFVKECLSKCVALANTTQTVDFTDDDGNTKSVLCDVLYCNFIINFVDVQKGSEMEITPITKVYVTGLNKTELSFKEIIKTESYLKDVNDTLGYLVFYGPQSVKDRPDFRAKVSNNDLYVSAEVISMDLKFPVIVGLYQKNKVSPIDKDGQSVETEQVSVELSIKNGDAALQSEMAAITTINTYNRLADSLIANGTITIPGVARVLKMLSSFQLYVYVSNKLDITSGNYRILNQSDNISNGVYTTTLEVYKESSLSGESVFGA